MLAVQLISTVIIKTGTVVFKFEMFLTVVDIVVNLVVNTARSF